MSKDVLKTQPFKTAPRDWIMRLSGVFVSRWWWVIALPPLALFAVAWLLSDLRFAILALMYIFICLPFIATFVWFNNVFTKEARLTTLTRIVEIRPQDKIIISFPDNPEIADMVYNWTDIREISHTKRHLVVYPKGNARNVIVIPKEAFDNEAENN
ncbi:MAG: YcxB family protein [Muribaculaceae bacterium]|nr:YcxB family protein [Muribaculaceae bacterium]